MNRKYVILLIAAFAVGMFFRLWHIEFGLPHDFYADEPELVEPAINYTYEIRNIIREKEFYKLFPISFVYGTFPSYLNTVVLMGYSKTLNLLNVEFGKFDIYLFLRIFNSFLSGLLIITTGFLAYKLSQNKKVGIGAAVLTALNWKLIVHGHYVNADIIQTVFLNFAFIMLYNYFKQLKDTKFTILTGIYFGIALGTKITTIIGLPLFLYIFLVKKDYKEMAGFILTVLGTYIITNPFSFILNDRFFFRVFEMFTKEAGLVFDSVDNNPFKYVLALVYSVTPFILAISLYGKYAIFKRGARDNREFHIFLWGNVLLYLIFFSLQSRRVDRWLLPIIPIVLSYAAIGMCTLVKKLHKGWLAGIIIFIIFASYLYFPILLLQQFQKDTPKSAAYLWLQNKVNLKENVLAYTEQGLDPLNKIPYANVRKVGVYTNEAAHLFFPADPKRYKYVVISSRPLEYYKKDQIKELYPLYNERWSEFETTLQDQTQFEVAKEFTLPKPNLIPLSDVIVYKNVRK